MIVVRKRVIRTGPMFGNFTRTWWEANYFGALYLGTSAQEVLELAWESVGGNVRALIFT